jgi:hypothetical protein
LVDQNGYKKGVYSEKKIKLEKRKPWMKKEELKKCKCN